MVFLRLGLFIFLSEKLMGDDNLLCLLDGFEIASPLSSISESHLHNTNLLPSSPLTLILIFLAQC